MFCDQLSDKRSFLSLLRIEERCESAPYQMQEGTNNNQFAYKLFYFIISLESYQFSSLFDLKMAAKYAFLIACLYVLLELSLAVGEFPPENHLLGTMDDNNRDVKLVLDDASLIKMKKLRKPSWRLAIESNYTPIVFWHGMGDTAFGSINVEREALQEKFPGVMVYSIQVGNNTIDDELAGYFTNVNYQIEQACDRILQSRAIKAAGRINMVGFSQGCQFLRGLIERCPLRVNGIHVRNFISLGGQHQGVFGLPNCNGNGLICNHIRSLLTEAAYERTVQEHIVQAEYWHDPLQEETYKHKNIFLADINNELNLNETYRENLLDLENFVLVKFNDDEMVVPRESSLFGFYESGQKEKIVPMEASSLYLKDRIGLRELDESGRLHQIRVPGRHLRYKLSWFLNEIASVYLDN